MSNTIAKAAADLVLRELSEVEASDIFGGTAWVKVGPIQPCPSTGCTPTPTPVAPKPTA